MLPFSMQRMLLDVRSNYTTFILSIPLRPSMSEMMNPREFITAMPFMFLCLLMKSSTTDSLSSGFRTENELSSILS